MLTHILSRMIPAFAALFIVTTTVNSAENINAHTQSSTPCRITMEQISWDASDYHLRLCLRINNERSCFPKKRAAFDNKGGTFGGSSFWLNCSNDYRYGFEWELFSNTTGGLMSKGKGAGSQVFHTKNGKSNVHFIPYFPRIQFTVTPYIIQP